MARKLRPRKGTTAQNNAYTGAVAEVTIDTTKKTLVVHDGATAGGNPLPTFADISSLIGVPSGIAGLDAGGKVPSAQLPSYVDDVLEFANLAALPATGETGKIYVALDTSKTYRWSGSVYVAVGANGDLLLTYADAFADVVLSGLVFPTSATRTSTMTSGVAEVIGTRVVVPATANTFTASRDTYVDLSNAGVLTYVGVANTILIEDCEDTWNESVDADATVSVVADVAAGQTLTNSNKIVVAATAVAGDVLATEAIASLNLSTATAARWWIKSSIATAAGDLHLLLGETAIVTTANAAEILAVPALTANTWTQVQVNFAGATTARDAIISVGLRYTVDIGACDLFIDDVQGIIPAPAAPAVTANSLRLQKVVTSSTAVTSVVQIASRELTANRNVSVPAPTLGGHATNKDFVSAELSAHNAAADPHTGYALESTIGVANGIAGLDGTGKVPAAQLPSYVDDVLEYANYAALPATGETGKIYIAQDTGASYRWTGTVYLKLSDDDVLQFANLAAFPASGAGAALYIAEDTSRLYRWGGAAYVFVGGLDAIPTMTMLGNNTGGSAVPTALTKAQVQTLLDIGWVLQSRSVAAPNATVPVHALTAVGAETNIDLALSPKGVGAILAALPDGAIAGGNKRGQNAVDLQTLRNAAIQVASGNYATVSGGWHNQASGTQSCVTGGYNNKATGDSSTVLGGANNTASGLYAIAGGAGNNASGALSIALGDSSGASNNYGIALGWANGTSGSSAAIIGGYTSQSSGAYSFIGGGYDNTANGTNASVIGGEYSFASGNYSFVGGGQSNNAIGVCAVVLGGVGNIAEADYSVALGYGAQTQSRKRTIVESAGSITTAGDVQVCRSVLRGQTTDATPLRLAVDGAAISAGNTFSSMTYQLLHIKGRCIARAPSTLGDYAIWEFTALMNQNANNSTVTLLAAVSPTLVSSGGTGNTWTLAVTADTTYGSLNVTATGAAAKTITWGCALDVLEVRDIA